MTQKIDFTTKEKIKNIIQNIRKNNNYITINDLGQGSKILKSKRKISKIHQISSSKGIYADLLYQIVKYYKCNEILEAFLASGNLKSNVTTIDASKETQDVAIAILKENEISNVNFVNSNFNDYLNNKVKQIFDLIFIDGHHNGKALLNYLSLLEKNINDETIIIIDDIRWSSDMKNTWNLLVSDQNYHLSLDLFRMGILIKRKHQAKEHFSIKIKGIIKGMI